MESTMTLEQQLACATRELAMRRRVYPRWVEADRIPAEVATHEIQAMAAIVATLEQLLALHPGGGLATAEDDES